MWEVVYMEIDEVGYEAAEMEVDKVADMVMKITIKDDLCDWRLVIPMEMLDVAMGVMDMEDDKVADIVLRIPNEVFTDGTVEVDDIISKWRWC